MAGTASLWIRISSSAPWMSWVRWTDRSQGASALPRRFVPTSRCPKITILAPATAADEKVPTRNAYGNVLKRIYPAFPQMVVLDGEVGNSTRAEKFKEFCPERFFEMYIAEQNMVGVAMGLASRGKLPFVSSFGAFLTRAFDQIRMCQYSDANIKFVGSHAGVSIGQDGPSQMALEDIAMFRAIVDGVVLYPCDAVSTERLVEAAAAHRGMVYIRTTRGATPIIYDDMEMFTIGGAKVLRRSAGDVGTLAAAGRHPARSVESLRPAGRRGHFPAGDRSVQYSTVGHGHLAAGGGRNPLYRYRGRPLPGRRYRRGGVRRTGRQRHTGSLPGRPSPPDERSSRNAAGLRGDIGRGHC